MFKKHPILSYSFVFVLISLMGTCVTAGFQLFIWIDHLFIVSLAFLILAGSLYVVRGGFFNTFVLSFRKFHMISKFNADEIKDDLSSTPDPDEKEKQDLLLARIATICLIVGIFSSLISYGLIYLL